MLGQVRAEGQYINEKIDLLVQYLLVDPFQSLYSRIFKHKARIRTCARRQKLPKCLLGGCGCIGCLIPIVGILRLVFTNASSH